MTQVTEAVHAPFRSIHLVMYLLTIELGAAPIVVIALGIAHNTLGDPGVPLMIAIVTAVNLAWVVACWVGYLTHQPAAYVSDDAIVFRTWLRLGSWAGGEATIPLAQVQDALLFRPAYAQFTIPGASTRVGRLLGEEQGLQRVGTYWWRRRDYQELQEGLEKRGIPTKYQQVLTVGMLLSSF